MNPTSSGRSAGAHAQQTRPLGLSLDRSLHELDKVASLPAPYAVREGAPVLARLLENPAFLIGQALPCLDATATGGPYVAQKFQGARGAYSLEIFVWPPGAVTAIHDHSCWGLIGSAFGMLHEERYLRLDDNGQFNQARLRRAWRRTWRPADGISTLLPYEGGVHRVSNPGARTVLSVHIYGSPGLIDGRDYDPSRDYVCDRLVDDTPARRVVQC
jgi:predicted metal-dependent enzyme (double-stranded beta helix superfamily)